ncbi:Zinc carboxypeptidase [Lentzea albidocapillata subsp. violacea]|uniref:Zinc carboxypeptidase n=1 Tax=Lentzea albidocapillata subsp. violacea TaxID=128104 RepID=A0A1G9MX08_9PSEU|nr:M14 family metallopeptidase [Lentzea albidocapillata]SDL78561.1 Zinc carboxypeptidase [Lentzea albidocapillata subsp. violacea]
MFTKRRGKIAAVLAICLPVLVAGMATPSAADSGRYLLEVTANTSAERTQVAQIGVDVLGATKLTTVSVVADKAQYRALQATGLPIRYLGDFEQQLKSLGKVDFSDPVPGQVGTQDFPSGYAGYHNFAETTAEMRQTVRDHPSLASMRSIGKSFQNRDIWALKVSDNVATDESEPEVLLVCGQHAREHLTVEQCLQIIKRYTDNYATPAIKNLIDSREVWIVPMMNPDGAEYDIATGSFRGWRKNRQGNGTDLNRNWGYKWGCCGGSSGSTTSDTYRGPSAFSAPETARIRDFVNSRVVGGTQQIKTFIDIHSFSELVLWPYGYTRADTAAGLNADEARAFQTLGRQMAATNGYTPEQASDLYITDGSSDDWMWGQHKIWAYTFEMYPSSGGLNGFYPRDTVIPAQTARNDRAIDLFLSYSDCVKRVIGQTC